MNTVISGFGMKTSVGSNAKETFSAFCEGISGNADLQCFDKSKHTSKSAYEIQDRPSNRQEQPYRVTKWLTDVINEALSKSQLSETDLNEKKMAILVGTGLRELRSVEFFYQKNQPFRVSKLHFSEGIKEGLNSYNFPVVTISNACSASIFTLGMAHDLLTLGDADIVIVAGCDTITESMYGLLSRVNPNAPHVVQPFDVNRLGVLMGEGAVAVVLEREKECLSRGGRNYSFLKGVGMSCDGHHETAPSEEGMLRAMEDALARSGVSKADIQALFPHGTGTMLNDMTESKALATFFKEQEKSKIAMSAIKSLTGHTSGASGLIGVVTAALSMLEKKIPPTAFVNQVIEEANAFKFVKDHAEPLDCKYSQVNAFGFGGVNAIAILERPF